MAVTIEGFTVVVQKARLQHLLEAEAFEMPNSTALADEQLWKCSFMAHADAGKFLRTLEGLGLNVSQGPDSDAVLVNEFDCSVEPYCEWLAAARWEKAVIAWLAGTRPESVVAREGWDPKVGSGLVFHDPATMKHLVFLRLEDNVEVFRDEKTGREVYIGRTFHPGRRPVHHRLRDHPAALRHGRRAACDRRRRGRGVQGHRDAPAGLSPNRPSGGTRSGSTARVCWRWVVTSRPTRPSAGRMSRRRTSSRSPGNWPACAWNSADSAKR